jgi:Ala-tRNA(Pro) deacylase
MAYHPLVEKIQTILKENNCEFETFEHEPVRTSEEVSRVRTGYTMDQGAKALIVRVKKPGVGKSFAMFVVQGSKKFDAGKVKQAFGLSDLRFATEQEVTEITNGVQIGGVPPLGNLFGLPVYVDRGLFDNDRIVFNAGDRSFSIGMKTVDWQNIVNPIVGDIV